MSGMYKAIDGIEGINRTNLPEEKKEILRNAIKLGIKISTKRVGRKKIYYLHNKDRSLSLRSSEINSMNVAYAIHHIGDKAKIGKIFESQANNILRDTIELQAIKDEFASYEDVI